MTLVSTSIYRTYPCNRVDLQWSEVSRKIPSRSACCQFVSSSDFLLQYRLYNLQSIAQSSLAGHLTGLVLKDQRVT